MTRQAHLYEFNLEKTRSDKTRVKILKQVQDDSLGQQWNRKGSATNSRITVWVLGWPDNGDQEVSSMGKQV
jgi:hypothetical protein